MLVLLITENINMLILLKNKFYKPLFLGENIFFICVFRQEVQTFYLDIPSLTYILMNMLTYGIHIPLF